MSHRSGSVHCFYRHYNFTSLEAFTNKAVQSLLQTADISKVYSEKVLTLDILMLEYMYSPVHADFNYTQTKP